MLVIESGEERCHGKDIRGGRRGVKGHPILANVTNRHTDRHQCTNDVCAALRRATDAC